MNIINPNSRSLPARPRRSVTALVLLGVLVAGCAAPGDERSQRDASSPFPAGSSLPDGSVRIDTGDARLAQLWSAAQQARASDNDAQSLEYLYQALEIEPQNPLFWSRAAEIQLDNEQGAQAENFAIKSNTFAGENRALAYRNWLIIEHARQMRGDLLGVRSAHRKVQQYQYQ